MFSRFIKTIFKDEPKMQRHSWCPVCENQQATFAPLPDSFIETARQYGFMHYDKWEMLSLDAYGCTKCGASDRERIYALWITQQIEKGLLVKGSRLIHFAPEVALSKKIRSLNFFNYKTADLIMNDVDYNVDMTEMPFGDESFDFFICSHVLEHVDSDDQAIKELYRITRQGCCGILVAPLLMGIKKTEEDPNMKDEGDRWRLYGQNDHVRLYAHDDYVNKIRSHGFRVDELDLDHFGEKVFRMLGMTSTSILYVVSK